MAEGWARHLNGDIIEAYSAGIDVQELNQHAVKVMKEARVDISEHRSKHLEELKRLEFDYVITVCTHAHETCPYFHGKAKVIHVGFDDPPKLALNLNNEEDKLNCYRRIRDEIRDFVGSLPESLIKK